MRDPLIMPQLQKDSPGEPGRATIGLFSACASSMIISHGFDVSEELRATPQVGKPLNFTTDPQKSTPKSKLDPFIKKMEPFVCPSFEFEGQYKRFVH